MNPKEESTDIHISNHLFEMVHSGCRSTSTSGQLVVYVKSIKCNVFSTGHSFESNRETGEGIVLDGNRIIGTVHLPFWPLKEDYSSYRKFGLNFKLDSHLGLY